MGASPSPQQRRRPGRFRRWLLRPVVWAVVAVITMAALGLWAIHRPSVQDRIVALAIDRAEDALGRVVTVGRGRFTLLPMSIELEELVLAGPRPGAPSVLEVDWLRVEGSLFELARRRIDLSRVSLRGVRCYLERLADRSTNLPQPGWRMKGERRTARPRLDIDIRRVEIEDGRFVYEDEQIDMDLDARDVSASFAGMAGLRMQGDLTVQRVTVRPPKGESYTGSVVGRVALDREGLSVQAVRVTTAEGYVDLDGRVLWHKEQRLVDLRVKGEVAIEVLARLGYLHSDVRGDVSLEGRIQWRPGSWGVRADASASHVDASRWTLRDLVGTLSADRNGVWLDVRRARYADGVLHGTIEVARSPGRPPSVEVDLTAKRVDAEQALADAGIPLRGIASRLSGGLDLRFQGGDWRHGSGWGDFIVTERVPGETMVPLQGTLPIVLDGGVVEARAVRLVSSLGTETTASIRYDLAARQGEIVLDVESRDVGPLARLLPGYDPSIPRPFWLPERGAGEATIVLRLAPQGAAVEASFDLTDVASPLTTADRARGTLALGRDRLERIRVELERPGAALLVSASVPLGDAAETGWRVGVDAAGWPLAEAAPLVPFELPLSGPFTGSVNLVGSDAGVSGVVGGRLRPGRIGAVDVEAIDARLTITPERIDAERFTIDTVSGPLMVTGRLRLGDRQLNLDVRAPALELGALFLDREVTCRVALEVVVGGSLDRPELEGTVQTERLAIGGREVVGDEAVRLEGSWRSGVVEIDGSLFGLAQVHGGGRIEAGDVALEIRARVPDLQPVAALVTELPVGGDVEGRVILTGEPGDDALRVELSIDRLVATLGSHPVHNIEPIRLALDGDTIRVDSLYLAGELEGTELFATGRIGTAASGPVDLRVQSTLDNRWLELFFPGFQPNGTTDLLAHVGGTVARPAVVGQARTEAPRVLWTDAGLALESVRGILLFDPGAVVVDTLEAEYAGGTVQAEGRVSWLDGAFEGRLQAALRGASFPYPEGWRLEGDADLVWSLDADRQLIRGGATIERGGYLHDIDVSLDQVLTSFFASGRKEVGSVDSGLDVVELNIAVEAPGTLRIRNNLANLTAGGELAVRGTLAQPRLIGELRALPGGTLTYSDLDYDLERGRVTFANPQRIEPVIDVVVTTEVAEYDVRMTLFGSPERLQTSFASDPPLSDLEVLSLLLGGAQGRSSESLRPDTRTRTSTSGAEGFLVGQAATAIGRRVGSLFGLDAFRVEPLTSGGSRIAGARFTAGKRLSSRLFVSYTVDPSAPEDNLLQVEWLVSDKLLVLLTQRDNAYGIDLVHERRY